jgi:hypothetical protein
MEKRKSTITLSKDLQSQEMIILELKENTPETGWYRGLMVTLGLNKVV